MARFAFIRLAGAGLFFGLVGLVGCSTGSVDQQPIERSFVLLNTTLEEVYYKLTANQPALTYCDSPISPQYYPGRQEFRVYYGGYSAMGPAHHVGVYGAQEGQGVRVNIKTWSFYRKAASVVESYLKTGRCS